MRPSRGAVLPEQVVVVNGCGSVVECWAHCICDAGDAVMVLAPYYGGFDMDLEKRAGVRIAPCALPAASGWAVTEEALERGLSRWNTSAPGTARVKGLLLVNPHNPLGICYGRRALAAAMRFASRHGLHVLSDEIYLLSIFEPSARRDFVPALSLSDAEVPDWRRLSVCWGFSKDFAASGFRVGTFASHNDELVAAMQQLAYFHSVPTPTQRALCAAIDDAEWVRRFVHTNCARLGTAQNVLLEALAPLLRPSDGCPALLSVTRAVGGVFTWFDFSAVLRGDDAAAMRTDELVLWNEFLAAGVYIAPGAAFHSTEPGRFRIVFSQPAAVLREAAARIVRVVQNRARRAAQNDCGYGQFTPLQSDDDPGPDPDPDPTKITTTA